jgi:hypothetical protein
MISLACSPYLVAGLISRSMSPVDSWGIQSQQQFFQLVPLPAPAVQGLASVTLILFLLSRPGYRVDDKLARPRLPQPTILTFALIIVVFKVVLVVLTVMSGMSEYSVVCSAHPQFRHRTAIIFHRRHLRLHLEHRWSNVIAAPGTLIVCYKTSTVSQSERMGTKP